MDEKQVIIVFGGSGFIGNHLLNRLKLIDKYRLVSVDKRPPTYRVDGVEYLIADVRNLANFEVEGSIHKIYNLAAVHTTPGHPTHEYYETNIAGATEITAFARRRNVNEIIFTSSISVYGPGEESKAETTKPTPESAYGWSKWLAEGIHRSWLQESEARRLVIARPAVIFGPHENGNFTRMASLLKKGFFIYPGRTDTIKACFYVEDLISAFFYAEETGERYVLFNGCYPDRYTIKQIVTTLRDKYFTKAKEFTVPFALVRFGAMALKPFSLLGLGIHPDRVNKLVRSTDIYPGWLISQGIGKTDRLPSAIDHWGQSTSGNFE